MHSNQRARLVLHPVVLVALIVIVGLAVGLGIVWRRTSETPDARGIGTAGAKPIAGLQISSDHLDFGDVGVDRSVSLQLRLENSSPDPIALRIEGADAFLVDPRRFTVQPNSSARVTVTANPTKPGAIQDHLRLFKNGASEPALVVTLDANGRSGAIDGRAAAGIGVAPVNEPPGDALATNEPAGSDLSDPPAAGSGTSANSAVGTQPSGSVEISRTISERTPQDGDSNPVTAGARTPSGSGTGSMVGAPFDPTGRVPRSIADRPTVPASGAAAAEGESPVPISHNDPNDAAELEQKKDPSSPPEDPPQASAFTVASSSSLSLMGTSNKFYPQQIGVYGSESGGSFSLMTGIQFPRIPLAFGQSVTFAQNGPALCSFDPGSGQVTIQITLNATDTNGRTASFPMSLTTGTVVTRNGNGVLVSVNGQPRVGASGQLRLVGIGKIPLGVGNQAEEQLVMVNIVAALGFGSAGSASSGGGQ